MEGVVGVGNVLVLCLDVNLVLLIIKVFILIVVGLEDNVMVFEL